MREPGELGYITVIMQFKKYLAVLLLAIVILSFGNTMVSDNNTERKISQAGIELIKKFEGYRDKAYLCSAGQWTIGWGSTLVKGVRVKKGDSVTPEAALEALQTHLDRSVCPQVIKHVKTPLSQPSFDALCSFVYNTGEGGLRYYSPKRQTFVDSQVKQKLNAGDYQGAADALLAWDKAPQTVNGVVKLVPLPGLTARRKAERELFLSGLESA